MGETLDYLYSEYKGINDNIEEKTKEKDQIYNRLINTKVGKFYFELSLEQRKEFRNIYSNTDITRYLLNDTIIKEYSKARDKLLLEVLDSDTFPFKGENAIYIRDGIDTYNALTDESTKDLDLSDDIKRFIQDVISKAYKFEDEYTIDDIPLIKVIYDKINIKIKEDDSKDSDINGIIEYIILQQVKVCHNRDRKYLTYRDNRRYFIADLKESIANNELEIRNSDSGFKYLLLFLVETAKYEVSLLDGKRATTLLKEIEESNMSESDKDYYKDALVKAYYNLTNIKFKKECGYFDNDNGVCYADFETANPEINKRLIKMRQGR